MFYFCKLSLYFLKSCQLYLYNPHLKNTLIVVAKIVGFYMKLLTYVYFFLDFLRRASITGGELKGNFEDTLHLGKFRYIREKKDTYE